MKNFWYCFRHWKKQLCVCAESPITIFDCRWLLGKTNLTENRSKGNTTIKFCSFVKHSRNSSEILKKFIYIIISKHIRNIIGSLVVLFFHFAQRRRKISLSFLKIVICIWDIPYTLENIILVWVFPIL